MNQHNYSEHTKTSTRVTNAPGGESQWSMNWGHDNSNQQPAQKSSRGAANPWTSDSQQQQPYPRQKHEYQAPKSYGQAQVEPASYPQRREQPNYNEYAQLQQVQQSSNFGNQNRQPMGGQQQTPNTSVRVKQQPGGNSSLNVFDQQSLNMTPDEINQAKRPTQRFGNNECDNYTGVKNQQASSGFSNQWNDKNQNSNQNITWGNSSAGNKDQGSIQKSNTNVSWLSGQQAANQGEPRQNNQNQLYGGASSKGVGTQFAGGYDSQRPQSSRDQGSWNQQKPGNPNSGNASGISFPSEGGYGSQNNQQARQSQSGWGNSNQQSYGSAQTANRKSEQTFGQQVDSGMNSGPTTGKTSVKVVNPPGGRSQISFF